MDREFGLTWQHCLRRVHAGAPQKDTEKKQQECVFNFYNSKLGQAAQLGPLSRLRPQRDRIQFSESLSGDHWRNSYPSSDTGYVVEHRNAVSGFRDNDADHPKSYSYIR
jgi:hypothetical protein